MAEMDIFAQRKNFFPSITDDYQHLLWYVCAANYTTAVGRERFEKLKVAGFFEKTIDPFDNEIARYDKKYGKQPRKCTEKDSVFSLKEYFQGKGVTSLVRCLKDGDGDGDGDGVNFQVVDPVTSLEGKYVLVVCTFVPCIWLDQSMPSLCNLFLFSKEIASKNDIHNFEILIVPFMRINYKDDVAAFKQFMSGFPNCLAVSFDNPDLRNELCFNLNFSDSVNGILIDPTGVILKDNIFFLDRCGASAFPFTDDRIKLEADADMSSLTSILRCQPSTLLYKLGFPCESITVEQLSKKVVLFYVFRIGDMLDMLNEFYHLSRLREKAKGVQPEFEIVLYCLSREYVDPATYESEIHQFLKEKKHGIDASSWWVCRHYDNSARVRLMQKCDFHDIQMRDAVISIGPDGEFIDFNGGRLLRKCGDEAYPFSVNVLIHRFVKWAEEITLESLLSYHVDKLRRQDGSLVDVKELQRKNVILYFDSPSSPAMFDLDYLIKLYPRIKSFEPDVEVVFVPSKPPQEDKSTITPHEHVCPTEDRSGIPWTTCRYVPELADFLTHHSSFYAGCNGMSIWKGLDPSSIVAFGKGGRIHALNVSEHMWHYVREVGLFSPEGRDLFRDIYLHMRRDLRFLPKSPPRPH